MILICSDMNEPSTDIVCSWLRFFNKKFVRISMKNIISVKRVTINDGESDIIFNIDDKEYKMSQFTSYWYRRSYLKFKPLDDFRFEFENEDLTPEIKTFLAEEYDKVKNLFQIKLSEIAKLNNFKDNYLNKLKTLHTASKLGIHIPYSLISNEFTIEDFLSRKWITKPVSDLIIEKGQKRYFSTTKRVKAEDLDTIEMSLIQEEVNKKFEVRSFFFNNEFYSSIIFSQGNSKTELDFRNYDTENPNRVVPYKLPDDLENKLRELCRKLDLNSGSFDLAYTEDNKYVLFEINPVGQFEQVSFPCNFQIHKKIAQLL